MSWKIEVIADTSGKWTGNMLRFATREEAEANAQDLARKWHLVQEWRTIETDDPVSHAYVHGKSVLLVAYAIRAIGFADNLTECPHAGHWLKDFDHDYDGGRGLGTFTRDPERAMRFSSRGDAMNFWRRTSKLRPMREDGKPNRPMTALTISVERL